MINRTNLQNAFEFVTLASARARQLMTGCVPRVDAGTPGEKKARTAQREVAAGEVRKVDPPSSAV